MKSPLWFVVACLCLLPAVSFARDDPYAWALKQYKAKEDSVKKSVEGEVDGERFLAVIVSREFDALLAVYKREAMRYVGVGQMNLPESPTSLSEVEIKGNSIFVEVSFAHHGSSDTRYQFKKVDGRFRLIGVESENGTWRTYYDEKNAPSDCQSEVNSGNSYNLLSLNSICWVEIVPESKIGSKRSKKYQPRGVQHKMAFSKVELPLLDGFNPEEYSPPESCYFDYKKRLHLPKP